jgi:hypothetical protein
MRLPVLTAACLLALAVAGCKREQPQAPAAPAAPAAAAPAAEASIARRLADYVSVPLTADLSGMDAEDRRMLALLVQACEVMDRIYWEQSWPEREALLAQATDADMRRFIELNYGPWDRLKDDEPFVPGVGPRPPGLRFYPAEMTKEEFEAADLPGKTSWYTLVRFDAGGKLITVPYHVAYREHLERAADLLRQAAPLSKDKAFGDYLRMRADALLDDDYQPSDLAWMDMKTNPVDIVIGPIETYEDRLFGYKASYEGLVLVKDRAWSEKLARFAKYLPELQRGLPVPERYKAERPGTSADLNAYNAIFYAGSANAGPKTIAINLPNDEQVQLRKGTRRLQLENVIHAKFDRILLPIARELIAEDQLQHVTFDAFFEDTMFHEVAHGLGIKNTLDGKQTVTQALKDYASSFEEGKADVLGLYLITELGKKGELDPEKRMDNYVTFLAGILRSVRFGASEAHGQANMVRFNFFEQQGAFSRDPSSGRYRVDAAKMAAAVDALSERLLTIQGDGDYAAAKQMTETMGKISPTLAGDLERLETAGIPVDVRFEQGLKVLGLEAEAAAATPAGAP